MKRIKTAKEFLIIVISALLIQDHAIAQTDERIPSELMMKIITNPVVAVVIDNNVPLYYDDPQKGRNIRDTLSRGERVIVWWLGEPLDGPLNVYSPRSYFGSVDGRHLQINQTEEQLWTLLMESLETQRGLRTPSNGHSDGPDFTVVSVIPKCKYFVAETPKGYSVVDEHLCPRPSRSDKGYGDLNKYSSVTVKLNGSSCSVWIDNYMMSKSSSLALQAKKCN